jgi:hypothetical protein
MIDIPKYYGMSLAANTLAAQQSADDKKKRAKIRLSTLKRAQLLKLAGQYGFLVKQTNQILVVVVVRGFDVIKVKLKSVQRAQSVQSVFNFTARRSKYFWYCARSIRKSSSD